MATLSLGEMRAMMEHLKTNTVLIDGCRVSPEMIASGEIVLSFGKLYMAPSWAAEPMPDRDD